MFRIDSFGDQLYFIRNVGWPNSDVDITKYLDMDYNRYIEIMMKYG